jgi:hypothetical protein
MKTNIVLLLMLCAGACVPAFAQETIDVIYVLSGRADLDQKTGTAMAGVVDHLNDAAAGTTGDYYRLVVVTDLEDLNDYSASWEAGDRKYDVVHGEYYIHPWGKEYAGSVGTSTGSVDDSEWQANAQTDASFHCGMHFLYDFQSRTVGTVYPDHIGVTIAGAEGGIPYAPIYEMAPLWVEY